VVQRSTKIDPAMVDVEGSDANIIVGVASVMADACIKQLGFRTAAHLLDGSEGDDLDRFAYDRYTLTRKGASAALTTVSVTRATTAAGAGSVPVGTRTVTDTGVEYVTITTANFGAGDKTSRADVRAVQAGKATQVGLGAIKRFADPGALFDKTLQCTNDEEPAAGGEDAENDDVFKARVRDFWRTARRGVLGAIEFGATTVPGIVSARAIEVVTPIAGGLPARVVQLYVADSSGLASRALAQRVQTALDDFRAAGIAVIIFTSLPLLVTITLKLTFRANVDTASLTDQVRAAIVAFVNSLPVNGRLNRLDLGAVLRRFSEDGLLTPEGTIVAPTGDLVPDVGQTLRTLPELVQTVS